MTLEQLKMLKMVAELGTLKAAAAALFKTQPAISQGIKQLEGQLGLVLFSREGYRLTLTLAGRQIYLKAVRLLSNAEEITQLSQHLAKGVEASVTLAIEAAFDLTQVLPLLEMTQGQFPDTSIVIRQEYMSGAMEAVMSDQADIAISASNNFLLESIDVQSHYLYQDSLISVVSPRLLGRYVDLHDVNDLRNEYQIVVQDSGKGSQGKELGVQQGQRRWYVNDFNSKKTLILSGMGWGKLPRYLIAEEIAAGDLCKLSLENAQTEISVDYYAMKSNAKVFGPVATQLWENLATLFE